MSSRSKTFTLFPSLPPELRLKIWRHSFTPRVVEVFYYQGTDECRTTTKPPATLRVCKEARDEAQRFYRKVFSTRTREGSIYFCPALDVLYLPRHRQMGYDDTSRDFAKYVLDTTEHIVSLAIDRVLPDIRRPWETYNKYCLMQNFPNLQNAFMVLTPESETSVSQAGDEIELVDPKGDASAVLRLMDDVLESFCYEVGPDVFSLEDDGSSPCHGPPHLVPKSKAATHGHESRSIQCI